VHNTVAADFFTVEAVTPYALVTFYVLFFIHRATRRVLIAGVTANPDTTWMMQIARNVTMEGTGFLDGMKYLIHDRDSKFCPAFSRAPAEPDASCPAFDHIIESAGVNLVPLPPKSPNLNAYAERFVPTVKSECLWRLLVFGEEGLWHAITEHVAHYRGERNHQSLGSEILFPDGSSGYGDIECRERLGGLLKYYYRKAG
jgi:hypothetical protein